ncbi:MAG: hypothetical protein FD167_1747 [bacterium]|nr:MAG: hypothetical protein FD167_1747 [bacterium]
MKKVFLPKVKISYRVWTVITNEVAKWAKIGKESYQSPLECVFYPLTAISLNKKRALTPFDTVNLKDIRQFTLGDVFIPPEQYTNYSSYAASFSAPMGQEQEMQQVFAQGIETKLKKNPQFYFLGPGHSHPFSVGTTSPSSTDINHHMLPYRNKNEELLGFGFSLAIIVTQHPKPIAFDERYKWQACVFALDEYNQVQDLGVAETEGFNDLLQPFYYSHDGNTWETLQKAFLGEKLIEHQRWPGGWTSFLIRENEEKATLIMLPPRFPTQMPVKQTISLITKQAGESEFWDCGRGYKNYCLGDINSVHYLKQA